LLQIVILSLLEYICYTMDSNSPLCGSFVEKVNSFLILELVGW